MTFKAGDKVRYNKTDKYPEMAGWEAEVVNVGEDRKGLTRVRTTVPGGLEWAKINTLGYYYTSNLELTTPTFTYEDIQKGDKIRRTKVYADGSTEVREGVAGYKGSYYWANFGENYILAYDPDHEALEGVIYELLERPEPPAPKLWENRKTGDQITTYKAGGNLDRIFTKRDDGRWDTLVINDVGKLQLGFERSDHELSICLHGKEAHLVN